MLTLIILTLTVMYPFTSSDQVQSEFYKNLEHHNNKLSLEFLKTFLEKGEKNILFSPLNIYTAIALVHAGATGTTKDQISSMLGFPTDDIESAKTHKNFGEFLRGLQANEDSVLQLANGIFPRKELPLKTSYIQKTKDTYQSEIQTVDFAKIGPEATDIVNKWVAEKTKNRIPKLFQDEISKDTQLLIASALYFAGKWHRQFYDGNTKLETFDTGAEKIQVQTMNATNEILYLDDKNLQIEAISIPYFGEFAMLVVLPYPTQSVTNLAKTFTAENLSQLRSAMKTARVNYKIPRIKFSWSQDIVRQLTKLGLEKLFQKADLDNMVESNSIPLAVSKVTHATEIEVNEKGTEASAVTVVELAMPVAAPPPPLTDLKVFYADRTFLFKIYHKRTGIPVFTGVVQNPNKNS